MFYNHQCKIIEFYNFNFVLKYITLHFQLIEFENAESFHNLSFKKISKQIQNPFQTVFHILIEDQSSYFSLSVRGSIRRRRRRRRR
jgi:hypothetical protein